MFSFILSARGRRVSFDLLFFNIVPVCGPGTGTDPR